MPRHRGSPGSRLLAPIVLGVAAFATLGSVEAGAAPTPLEPVGDVLDATNVAPMPATPELRQVTRLPMDRPDAAAHRGGPPPIATLRGYRWPLPRGRVTLPFGPTPWGSRIVDGAQFHDGVDLATFCGDRIVAAHDGVVLAAGRRYDDEMGWIGDLAPYYDRLDAKRLWMSLPIMLVIDDGNGYRSLYAHFERLVVKEGQGVRARRTPRLRGRDRTRFRLPSPLRSLQPAGDRPVRPGSGGRQADETAGRPDRTS